MQTRTLIFLLLAYLPFQGCCWNCRDHAPARGGLDVKVSEKVSDSIDLSIYNGKKIENGDRVIKTVISEDTSFIIPANEAYSAKAVYRKNGKKVIAVDRDEFEVKERHDRDCADTCFVVKKAALDLVLDEKPF